ncbi:MAG TPA: hypothetical protein VKU02_13940 [Gemmataceae bacterium]|nr:hypothetical protein [Gemmataceae bacterium]
MIRTLPFALSCWLGLCSCFLFPVSLARAALDPETTKPYHFLVVLRIAENRLATPVFREIVERELGDSLQAALGDLAQVKVVRDHPLLKEVEAKGLQLALNGYSVLSDTKIHFVLIDYRNGYYEIEARQYDGFTGLASPVVRHSSTADRQLVARSAALLIDQDFGLAGTVGQIKGDRIDITLRGGALGVPLGRWVQVGQVFAVTQITQGTGHQQRSFRMPWTLLQVLEEPKNEVCRCRLLSRWQNPLPQEPSVLGYRCLKLGTTQGRLRLRLVRENDKLRTPVPAVQVRIGARGFDVDSNLERISTKQDGLVESAIRYDNVAFVEVRDGEKLLARVPVEILDDQTITCPVNVSSETAAQGELLHRRQQWLRRVNESLEVANNLVNDLNRMQSSESALARAQAGFQAIQNEMGNLTTERDNLRAEGAKDGQKGILLSLTEGAEGIQQLEGLRTKLQGFIADLQASLTEEKDPKRQKWKELAAKAKLLEEEAEFDKAIEFYQSIRDGGGDTPQLREKIETLQRARAPKNPAHAKAQAFIYETWPKLETAAQINARLNEARQAFETCKEVGDRFAPQKLLVAYRLLTTRLEKESEGLNPEAKEDDRKTTELIIALAPKLKEFNEQVKEYLRTTPPK